MAGDTVVPDRVPTHALISMYQRGAAAGKTGTAQGFREIADGFQVQQPISLARRL